MIRFAIIEAEDKSANILMQIMSQHFTSLLFEDWAGSVYEAVIHNKETSPHLIFLDKEQPDGSWLDLLGCFEQSTFKVVFTTVYDQDALPVIKFSAIDFLLKP